MQNELERVSFSLVRQYMMKGRPIPVRIIKNANNHTVVEWYGYVCRYENDWINKGKVKATPKYIITSRSRLINEILWRMEK